MQKQKDQEEQKINDQKKQKREELEVQNIRKWENKFDEEVKLKEKEEELKFEKLKQKEQQLLNEKENESNFSELKNTKPDYALLLSWHMKDSIMSKIRQDGFRGKFIIPLPNVEIV